MVTCAITCVGKLCAHTHTCESARTCHMSHAWRHAQSNVMRYTDRHTLLSTRTTETHVHRGVYQSVVSGCDTIDHTLLRRTLASFGCYSVLLSRYHTWLYRLLAGMTRGGHVNTLKSHTVRINDEWFGTCCANQLLSLIMPSVDACHLDAIVGVSRYVSFVG